MSEWARPTVIRHLHQLEQDGAVQRDERRRYSMTAPEMERILRGYDLDAIKNYGDVKNYGDAALNSAPVLRQRSPPLLSLIEDSCRADHQQLSPP
jgi:hypothetical protein